MPHLLLIDGHSQAYRAYFGMKAPLTTRDGEPTAAVYGLARKLLSTLRDVQPDCVAVALDTGDTWRHAEFPAYKATRDAMPDDMRTQMVRIEAFLHAFNIPIITYTNLEADDILGTLAKAAAAEGADVLVMTGDRDMFQLVDDRVQILHIGRTNPVTSVYGRTGRRTVWADARAVHRLQGAHGRPVRQYSGRPRRRRKDRRQVPPTIWLA